MNNYRRGRIAEKKVVNWLQAHGHTNVRRSAGSRGPADVYSVSPKGYKTYTQVKSSGASLDSGGRRDLRELAKDRRGFAQYVHYGDGRVNRVVPLGNWAKKKKAYA
jgi:hypothetical protein